MTYIAVDDSADGTAKVLYESKDGKATKIFDALDWPRQRAAGCPANGMQAQALAQLVTHIPTKGESAGGGVRYGVYPPLAEILLK